jgi:hypothetical protein
VVVDVKPEHMPAKPTVAYTFAWTRRLVEARGWQYEVWIGAPSPELENLRFLAGYRRPWLFDAALLNEVRAADVDGRTVAKELSDWTGKTIVDTTNAHYAPGHAEQISRTQRLRYRERPVRGE